jgi:hypothetical protein
VSTIKCGFFYPLQPWVNLLVIIKPSNQIIDPSLEITPSNAIRTTSSLGRRKLRILEELCKANNKGRGN